MYEKLGKLFDLFLEEYPEGYFTMKQEGDAVIVRFKKRKKGYSLPYTLLVSRKVYVFPIACAMVHLGL